MSEVSAERKKLVQLIREIAREEAWQIVDEHLEEYEHKERKAEEF